MKKAPLLVSGLLVSLLFWGVLISNSFGAESWVDIIYDQEVPSETKENFQKAFDAVNALLTKYKIVLSNPITIVVITNDAEKYIQALMFYYNISRTLAEKKAKYSGGISSSKKPVIIIRWIPTRQSTGQGTSYPVNNPEEGFRALPHELFHQVQDQYTRVHTANWLEEGSAELFRWMAFEAAGIRRVTILSGKAEQAIRNAAKIPDTRQLASCDHTTWGSLNEQKYPVYPMAALMTYRLVGDNGFEKVILFYQLLHNGSEPDKAFITAFGVQMSDFLADMNDYFNRLTTKQKIGEK
jgi:hypothetical protein